MKTSHAILSKSAVNVRLHKCIKNNYCYVKCKIDKIYVVDILENNVYNIYNIINIIKERIEENAVSKEVSFECRISKVF